MSKSDEAKYLISSALFRAAMDGCLESILSEMRRADPADTALHQSLIIALQQLDRVESSIVAFIDDDNVQRYNKEMAKAVV